MEVHILCLENSLSDSTSIYLMKLFQDRAITSERVMKRRISNFAAQTFQKRGFDAWRLAKEVQVYGALVHQQAVCFRKHSCLLPILTAWLQLARTSLQNGHQMSEAEGQHKQWYVCF